MAKQVLTTAPWCPFCGQKVGRAGDAEERKMNEFPVGDCQCGAVYTCDATGHNIGAAMVDALVYACDANADFAWELMPEDDYLTGRIENYDEQTHQVVTKENIDGRMVRGILYFVRLHSNVSDIAKKIRQNSEANSQGSNQPLSEHDTIAIEPAPDEKRLKKKANKKSVKELVDKGDIDSLVSLCFDDKKTMRLMQRLLYSPSEHERWYIAWVMGQVGARVSTREPGQVSELLHRLFEACSDSAATPWGMVETIGSVISMRPDIFGAFARHLLNYVGEPSTCPQVLWGLAEVAKNRPDLIRGMPFYSLFNFLQHPDAIVRGNAVRLMGRLKATEVTAQLISLSNDTEEFFVCLEGELVSSTVAAEVAIAMQAINEGRSNEK